jgi:putative nucleotidyltransferase with HDIG domain
MTALDAGGAAVLLVDDNASKRVAVQAMLSPLGYDVVEADSGRAALRAVLGRQYAVILMDVRMPTLDGYETAKLIRDRMQSELTPIIFLTAFGQDETASDTAYASGAVDFIFSPIRADVLRAKVSAFVDLFAQQQQLQRSLAAITELNAELRDAHAGAKAVLQNVADAIVTANSDGAIESFNRSARELFGYAEAEIMGRPLQLIIPPAEADGDLVGHRKDGSSFALEMNVSETQIGDRTVTIACIRDISERREQADRDRRHAQALEQAQFEMLARLAAVAEFRDDDTGQHTRRVGDLAVAIAERLGLPETQLHLMRLAAPLHDVGKIAIPDAVLGKSGELTVAEYNEMKTHTRVGAQMLAGSGFALLGLAEEIALTHHERWDGGGYPNGLSGDAIPIAGRIVAVADVFDALTHARPYKRAWSVADALAEMTLQSGRSFDPAVLEAFLSLGIDAAA